MGVSFKGYADIATLLLDKNAKPNLQNANGGTALMLAAMFGRHELLKMLLSKGADKSIKDSRGLTALGLAQQQDNAQGVSLLQ